MSHFEAVEVFLRLRREKGKQSVCPSDGRRRGTKPADPLCSGSSNRIGTGDTHRDISVAHFSDVAAVKDDMDSGIGEKRILKTFPYSLLSLLYHRFQSPKPAFIFVQLLFPSFYFSPRPRACRWQMLKSSGKMVECIGSHKEEQKKHLSQEKISQTETEEIKIQFTVRMKRGRMPCLPPFP